VRYFTVTKYARHPRVVDSVVADSVVLMNLDKLDYYALNEVAGRVWDIVGVTPSTQEDIVQVLLDEFDVDENACVAEVETFISDALEQGFLTVE
jgi:hypothetical protein